MLSKVHGKLQEGLRHEVELQVAQAKTAAVASSKEVADKIAQAIGIPQRVAVCKKLGVDHRLFDGGEGT